MPRFTVPLAVFCALLTALRANGFTLAKDGRPAATIVVAHAALSPAKDDDAARKVSAAAHDLQDYVRKMSGATLEIVGDDSNPKGPIVLVGKSALSDELHADIPSGLTPERKEEGFVIVAKGDRLLLAGNDAAAYHGTEYAVSRLLERLGVRWYMPGEFGEIVPTHATLEVADTTLRDAPDFALRSWWVHTTPEMAEQEKRWKIHNGMNPDPVIEAPGDSSVRDFVADKSRMAAEPELFAKNQDGSLNPYLPNLTNPKAVQIAADKFKEIFRRRPGLGSAGIAPDDGLPRDFNPETVKHNQGFVDLLGREGVEAEFSNSEEWFAFVNAVAREVKKEFPDKIIATNAYANRNLPPEGLAIEPNVSVMFAAIWSDTLHAYDDPKSWQAVRQGQMLKRWCELSDKTWVYGYNYTMLVSALTPVPLTRQLARDLPLMKKWGVIGCNDEARNQWMECGIPTKYLRARLEWRANADVKAILDEFYSDWYGPAAGPAREFWDALEDAIEGTPYLGHEDRILPYVYTPEMMTRCAAALDRAEKLADSDRNKLHVCIDRLIYRHLQGYVAMNAAEFAGNYAEAARQADGMMDVRRELFAINPFFVLDNEKPYDAGVWYWGVIDRSKYYRKLADLTGGATGDHVALLPERATFRTDPNDEGRFERWGNPDTNVAEWKTARVTQPFYAQGYMDAQGYPYTGYVWYRLEADVPQNFAGRKIVLLAPVLETEGWLWVNGQYVAHRPYKEAYERPNEFECNVTPAIQPGKKNVFVFRVNTGLSRAQAAGGLGARVILYAPK